ncbi:MAG: zinc ABC transporter substrate-binding protein [Dehalococcoidia bacterium]|jgi:zinc transport system substrate-binding protein
MKAQKYAKPVMVVATIVISLAMLFIPTSHKQNEASDSLSVTVTLIPYADFVRQVGGDKVDVTIMVPPGASPHSYEPTPSQMVSLSNTEVYVQAGSGIEFEIIWMDKLIEQNPEMTVINGSAGIDLMVSSDPDKPGMDPHVWTSPINAKIIVQNILDGLIAIDPDNENFYRSNAESCLEQLDEIDAYIHGKLDGYSNRHFLIYHPSFGYFSSEYGLEQTAIEYEGKEPTPQVLQDCIDLSGQYHLNYVFIEPQFVLEYAETIADATGGETVTIDALAQDYVTSMRNTTDALAQEFE